MRQRSVNIRLSYLLATTLLATSLPAAAQQNDSPTASSGQVEEIVVTARKRKEDVQKVPESISVLSGATLTQNHIQDYQDIARTVPGMSFNVGSSVLGGTIGPGTVAAAPTLPHFSDQIKDPLTRQAAQFIEFSRGFYLPLMAPPGIPRDTLDALRKAYVEMSKDPDFLADAVKMGGITVDITPGEEIAARVAQELKADPAVFEAARNLLK